MARSWYGATWTPADCLVKIGSFDLSTLDSHREVNPYVHNKIRWEAMWSIASQHNIYILCQL